MKPVLAQDVDRLLETVWVKTKAKSRTSNHAKDAAALAVRVAELMAAEKLNIDGLHGRIKSKFGADAISREAVSDIVRGKSRGSNTSIEQLASVFGVPIPSLTAAVPIERKITPAVTTDATPGFTALMSSMDRSINSKPDQDIETAKQLLASDLRVYASIAINWLDNHRRTRPQ